jgi:hypothetical protein
MIKKIVGIALIIISFYLMAEPISQIFQLDVKGFISSLRLLLYAPVISYIGWGLLIGFGMATKFVISVIIDIIGMATYLIPGLGEFADVIWAPIQGVLIYILYGNLIGAGIGIGEELFPGTDIIPSATLMWLYTLLTSRK